MKLKTKCDVFRREISSNLSWGSSNKQRTPESLGKRTPLSKRDLELFSRTLHNPSQLQKHVPSVRAWVALATIFFFAPLRFVCEEHVFSSEASHVQTWSSFSNKRLENQAECPVNQEESFTCITVFNEQVCSQVAARCAWVTNNNQQSSSCFEKSNFTNEDCLEHAPQRINDVHTQTRGVPTQDSFSSISANWEISEKRKFRMSWLWKRSVCRKTSRFHNSLSHWLSALPETRLTQGMWHLWTDIL